MGLFRGVEVRTSGPVAIRYPAVISKVESPENTKAHLTVTALLKNGSPSRVSGKLSGKIEGIEFSQDVELEPNQSKDVVFAPDQFSQLNIDHPRLWWPAQMGTPNLYKLHLQFQV